MKRRLFTSLAATSLAVWVAVAVLWARSYFRFDSFCWRPRNQPHNVCTVLDGFSAHGMILFQAQDDRLPPNTFIFNGMPLGMQAYDLPAHGSPPSFRVHVLYETRSKGSRHLRLDVPYALLQVFATIGSLIALQLLRRHLRRSRNPSLCPACGYDLRATPDRCPECGAVPEKQPPISIESMPK